MINTTRATVIGRWHMNDNHWFNSKWRPAMGWQYMIVCGFDFIIAPILWSVVQSLYKGNITDQWDPLTLQSGGLYHIAMGAILGVTVWSRGQEKIAIMKNGVSEQSTPKRR